MKPWELDAAAPSYPGGDVPPGGLGVDVPTQKGWVVSPSDQAIRDEAARRLREVEKNQPKPWEMDAAAPAETPAPKALPKSDKRALEIPSPAAAVYGLAETGSQMLTGTAAQAIGGIRGLGRLLTGQGLDKAVEAIKGTEEALTYQPHSQAGRDISAAAAYPFEQFNEGAGKVGEYLAGNEGRAIGENLLPVAGTVLPAKPMLRQARAAAEAKNQFKFPVRDETTGQITYYDPKDVKFARENAPKLQAHEAARERGIVTDPTATNPTFRNKLRTGLANRDWSAHDLSIFNEEQWNRLLKEDTGLNANAPLNDPATFRAVRDNAAVPAEAISRTGGQMYLTEGQIGELNGLRRDPTIASPEVGSQMDSLVNRSIETVIEGAPASTMLREIADLRDSARRLFKQENAGPEGARNAQAYIKIANILEEAVENNLFWQAERNPNGSAGRLAEAYREARRTMAKSYALEDATNMATGQVDPNRLAQIAAGDNALTGAFADVGRVAANFPEASRLNTPIRGLTQTRLYRSSPLGVLGGILGSMFGPVGTGAGAIAGAATGELLGRTAAHRMQRPSVQAQGINPVPRSLWEASGDPLSSRWQFGDGNPTREFGVAPEGGPPMLPAPPGAPGPRGPLDNPPAPYAHPNFQFGDNNPPQPRPPGTGVVPARPLTPEEQWAQDKGNFAAQDRVRYERERAMDEAAQAEAEANAAALRRPATGEQLLDLNPMTGRLESASRGLPGATPEVIRSTGSSLEGAAQKLAEGRAFAMTPEEKIAWKHTQTSLTEQVPELRGMSEKQVFERMRDRQWVADTIQKLREKDIAFEGIRRTADENAARAEAAKQREILADRLEEMQAQFDAAPQRQTPKAQGPKIRAFQRAQIDALRNKE